VGPVGCLGGPCPAVALPCVPTTLLRVPVAVVIHDTDALGAEEPYYTCDAKVVCAPPPPPRPPSALCAAPWHGPPPASPKVFDMSLHPTPSPTSTLCSATAPLCHKRHLATTASTHPLSPTLAQVRFELCAPIVDAEDKVLGIIDIEAWRPRLLAPDQVDEVLAACAALADARLGL
jgi:hypothetical protein